MGILYYAILLGMGVYVLWAGITGKGKLYAGDNIKEGMEEKFRKTMRRIYLALGAAMTLNGVVSALSDLLYTVEIVEEATETTPQVTQVVPRIDLGAFSFLTPGVLSVLTFVCMGLVIALIVVMIVVMRRFTDRNARRSAPAGQPDRQAGHVLPVDAFEFDDGEDDGEPEAPADAAVQTPAARNRRTTPDGKPLCGKGRSPFPGQNGKSGLRRFFLVLPGPRAGRRGRVELCSARPGVQGLRAIRRGRAGRRAPPQSVRSTPRFFASRAETCSSSPLEMTVTRPPAYSSSTHALTACTSGCDLSSARSPFRP